MKHSMVRPDIGNEEGQAITEYMILLSTVIAAFLLLLGFINKWGLAGKLSSPLQQSFARAYQYGAVDAYGYDDGTPKRHPRVNANGNFRIFINPSGQDSGGGE